MANGNLGKSVAIVALGGVTNGVVEYAATKVSKAGVPIGNVPWNVADAVGITAAVAEIGVGAVAKKPAVALFGAGGLAVSLATIIGKYLMVYNPLQARASAPLVVGSPAPNNPILPGKMTGTATANLDTSSTNPSSSLVI